MFVEKICASAWALVRGSGIWGSAELIVNGSNGWSWLCEPNEIRPVNCVRWANFAKPAMVTVCAELLGQRDICPRPGAPDASVRLSGLSQMSGLSGLLNHDPS